MMTRDQVHETIDNLPESELMMIARILEGFKVTRDATQPAQFSQAGTRPAGSPIKPVGSTKIRMPNGSMPLAGQYSDHLRNAETPEDRNLLRKVMFTRVSDLMAWVNKGQEPVR